MSPIIFFALITLVFALNFLLCCVILIQINRANVDSCQLSAHSLLIATLSITTCMYYATTSPYALLSLPLPTNLHWGLAVFFSLSRHLALIAFAMSRIVSLTFS
ncbi:hypothetical protein PFISCL1PPCAC_22780, partial [Pristionchus fissidentatus]